jgi:mRNA-degrading endonuclease toxin of MazEF toxin-antitoxin module
MAGVDRPLRWAIVLVDLDPTVGHEQAGHRRALVVSYEAFHASGMAAVCPVSARSAKYPGEIPIDAGLAGQTKDAVILCHQLRTIDLARVTAYEVGGEHAMTDRRRRRVRAAWPITWLTSCCGGPAAHDYRSTLDQIRRRSNHLALWVIIPWSC